MRNASIATLDHTPRAVVALGTDYPDGHVLPPHAHRRAQLLYGATGVMQVATADGDWLVPPQRAVWIPPGVTHAVTMLGVSTRSLYIEPAAMPALGPGCQVLAVSPLLRQLLIEAVDAPLDYDEGGRDGAVMSLLLHELARAAPLPLHVPMPADAALAALCQAFLRAPDLRQPPAAWAEALHLSTRSFSRRFLAQTGMNPTQWRQRACAVRALARLAAGEPVTRIALDMGYDSPTAFSTMFRRVLGQPPSAFLDRPR